MPELPEDNWHTYIFVSLACYCDYPQCNAEADLEWAWDGLEDAPNSATIFTIRAVEYLKREGWQMIGDYETYCPKCVAKRAKNLSD